ncbi:MAG: hypothetical protein RLZZ546_2988 [Bacteroidota bacterium]|jgi:hypothetical protein
MFEGISACSRDSIANSRLKEHSLYKINTHIDLKQKFYFHSIRKNKGIKLKPKIL